MDGLLNHCFTRRVHGLPPDTVMSRRTNVPPMNPSELSRSERPRSMKETMLRIEVPTCDA
jgi:hypothetical protein